MKFDEMTKESLKYERTQAKNDFPVKLRQHYYAT